MRVILIAVDYADAARHREQLAAGVEVVVVVTRRLSFAARGHTADELVWTPAAEALPAPIRKRLLAECVPCIYAGQAAKQRSAGQR